VTEQNDEVVAADSGVKVVGAPPPTTPDSPASSAPTPPTERSERARRAAVSAGPGRGRPNLVLAAIAAVAVILAVTFGVLYVTKSSSGSSPQDPAVISAANKFMTAFFNFNAQSVDADFNSITAMATGNFSSQANQFFNSAIRTQLEKALAESRGQVRADYVQSENDAHTAATVYAVVDQLYVNNKINTPQSDVVRLLIDLKLVGSTWKIANVTVLEGATPGSAGTGSGSAGSSVPGQ
jgi:hypothetical protein